MKPKPLASLLEDPCDATEDAEGGRAIAATALATGGGLEAAAGRLKEAMKSSSSIGACEGLLALAGDETAGGAGGGALAGAGGAAGGA